MGSEWLQVVAVILLAGCVGAQDSWELIVRDAGVSAMSATLMHTNRVVIYDRTDFSKSNLTHPDGFCRNTSAGPTPTRDCTAHSVALDLATNTIAALKLRSNPFCSSGAHLADGSLLSTGGWTDGSKAVRKLGPGANQTDDWVEYPPESSMVSSRWYASDHILPDNRVFVLGGRRSFSYEFVPRTASSSFSFQFLRDTNTPGSEHNLYPFVFLAPDGNLFIFANQDSILFDYTKNAVVRKYPRIPGGPRNYPASGSAVLLPMRGSSRPSSNFKTGEVLICGGCPFNAFQNANRGVYDVALRSCGRMEFTAAAPKWTMFDMPMPRVMGDMLLLAHGEVLIINGAGKGSAGWTSATDPVLTPITYDPAKSRFFVWKATTIPRMYHSVALVLPDQRVLVAGSNVNTGYDFTANVTAPRFPTELRIEKYSPFYINKSYDKRRPHIVLAPTQVIYGAVFTVGFTMVEVGVISVRLYAPAFATHSVSMNQRLLVLDSGAPAAVNATANRYAVTATAPPSANIAPSGFYLCSVVNRGTPGPAVWVKIRA